MNDYFDQPCYTTAKNNNTKPLSIAELVQLMNEFRRPPRREFIYEGMIHAILDDSKLRVSALFMEKLKAKSVPSTVENGGFSGIITFIDPELPSLPSHSLAAWIHGGTIVFSEK